MLISQCIFTNLQVVGKCHTEKTYNLFVNGLEREKKVSLSLKTICEKYHSPAAHLQRETLWKISFSIKISFAWKLK